MSEAKNIKASSAVDVAIDGRAEVYVVVALIKTDFRRVKIGMISAATTQEDGIVAGSRVDA